MKLKNTMLVTGLIALGREIVALIKAKRDADKPKPTGPDAPIKKFKIGKDGE